MKALVDRLEWVRIHLVDQRLGDAEMKEIAIEELLAAMAIAEALPDITIAVRGRITLPRVLANLWCKCLARPPREPIGLPE